jgi:predicted  nucleic acid-binding Zn-ribbon protein
MSESPVIEDIQAQFSLASLSVSALSPCCQRDRYAVLEHETDGPASSQKCLERIHQLEHALDQTLASLTELELQTQDHHFLETQLAEVEAFSHIQHHAIAKLHQYQHTLEQQIHDLEARTHYYQELLATGNGMPGTPLTSAQTELAAPSSLNVLTHDQVVHFSLQHFCQELAAERDMYRNQVSNLERNVTELQEHILQQDQHAQEQETAIQHWKDRASGSHRYALHLKGLLEQIIVEKSVEMVSSPSESEEVATSNLTILEPNALLPTLLAAFQPDMASDSQPSMAEQPLASSPELPAFLIRRRRHYYAQES